VLYTIPYLGNHCPLTIDDPFQINQEDIMKRFIKNIVLNICRCFKLRNNHGDILALRKLLSIFEKKWHYNNCIIRLHYKEDNICDGPILEIIDFNNRNILFQYPKDKGLVINNIVVAQEEGIIYILISDKYSRIPFKLLKLTIPDNLTLKSIEEENVFEKDAQFILDKTVDEIVIFNYNNLIWRIEELQSISKDGKILLLNCSTHPNYPYSSYITFRYYTDINKLERVEV
jgi:hypothetical protein